MSDRRGRSSFHPLPESSPRQALPDTVRLSARNACRGQVQIRHTRDMPDVLDGIGAAMSVEGYPQHDRFAVRLALEEAIVNAIKHGNRNDESKHVRIWWRVCAVRVKIVVADEGRGFDPSRVPDPTAAENLERSSGRGLLLMRTLMTWVRHSRGGACLAMSKTRTATPQETHGRVDPLEVGQE